MRAALLAFALAAAGCASTAAAPGDGAAIWPGLFPFEAASAAFTDLKDSSPRTMRVVPSPDGAGARLVLEVPGGAAREVRVTRRDGSLYFSAGTDAGTELLRGGARPGDAWESGGRRVSFDGWERVALPASSWDAARITARRGPRGLEQVETWWFAPGVGLVRLRSDHGALFVDELVRSSP